MFEAQPWLVDLITLTAEHEGIKFFEIDQQRLPLPLVQLYMKYIVFVDRRRPFHAVPRMRRGR